MGVSWHSHAEVISLEPEKIKQLIEEIDNGSTESVMILCNIIHNIRFS